MPKPKSRKSTKHNLAPTNFKNAWFAFPEGKFRVFGKELDEPGWVTEQEDSLMEADHRKQLEGILQDAYTLLMKSDEDIRNIVDWMIHDLELLKKGIE